MTARLQPMRIGVDARYLSHALVGGVHTYVTRLLPGLIEAGGPERFVIYADAKAAFEFAPPPGVVVRELPWRHATSSIANDWLRLRRWMARDGVNVAFFPANHGFGPRGAATVITLHDALNLNPLRRTLLGRGSAASLRSRATDVYLKLVTELGVRRATRLITMSGFSKDAIVAASGRAADDVTVVHHGAPPKVPLSAADVAQQVGALGIAPPFLLADGLKNPAVVLRAAARLAAAGGPAPRLVFFARHARVLPELSEAAGSGRVTLLIRPSAEALAALYSAAAVFVFPSWVEGFGIPLLEAMSYGAPIVASNRGSIPEIAGEAAMLVDADDDAALAQALHRVLAEPAEAHRLRSAGAARVVGFTWRRSAEETLAVLARAHADRARRQDHG